MESQCSKKSIIGVNFIIITNVPNCGRLGSPHPKIAAC